MKITFLCWQIDFLMANYDLFFNKMFQTSLSWKSENEIDFIAVQLGC